MPERELASGRSHGLNHAPNAIDHSRANGDQLIADTQYGQVCLGFRASVSNRMQ